MLARLRHRAVDGADHENRAVHLRRAGDHVLDVVGVARAVDVRVVAVRRRVLDVARRDRQDLRRVAASLRLGRLGDLVVRDELRPALVRRDLGQRGRQRGLAVVDVADGADVDIAPAAPWPRPLRPGRLLERHAQGKEAVRHNEHRRAVAVRQLHRVVEHHPRQIIVRIEVEADAGNIRPIERLPLQLPVRHQLELEVVLGRVVSLEHVRCPSTCHPAPDRSRWAQSSSWRCSRGCLPSSVASRITPSAGSPA